MTRILMAALCAAALGASACSSSGSSNDEETTAAEEQRAAINTAVGAARTAVTGLGDVSTDAEFAAAKKAVADADELEDGEKDAFGTAIEVIESSLSDAEERIAAARERRQGVLAAEADKLSAAFAAVRITDIGAAFGHGEAPAMSGTVPGTPAVPVADLETSAAGGAHSVGGWRGGTYTAADEGAGTSDTVVLYTNIEVPGARPFSGENGKYSSANGLDTDGNLPIVGATDAALIASGEFPTGPGIRSHEAGEDGTVRLDGSFDGAAGQYLCTPASGLACTSSVRQGGGYALAGGTWKFVPAEGAEVARPDTEYQYFGWWLRKTGGAYAVGAFHDGTGGAPDEFRGLAELQGRVTYRGPAIGKFALQPRIGAAEAGDFAATATLEVNFGDAAEPGAVEGTVDGFMVAGEPRPWSVALGSARIGSDGAIAAGGGDAALTVWSINDVEGATPATQPPTWSGQLHDVDEERVPAAATGTFDAFYGVDGRMIGAFGTTRQ